MSPDDGPNCSGSRAQFLRRAVAFADATGLVVRLVDDPPDHSQDHPVERCRAAPARTWRGGLLTSPEVIRGYARRMTWRGQAPAVDPLTGEDPDGVRLTRAEMRPVEARLERSKTLPTYDLTVRPKTPNGRSRTTCRTPKNIDPTSAGDSAPCEKALRRR